MAGNGVIDNDSHSDLSSATNHKNNRRAHALVDSMIIEVLENNLYALRLRRDYVPAMTEPLVSMLRQLSGPAECVQGIIVDVRAVTQLSVVRLASFLDTLTPLAALVAVLVCDKEQSRLARLLHNTLINKDSVAYFTDERAAFMYLALTV